MTDPFDLTQRPPVSEPIKQGIRDAFAIVPPGKTSALVAIYDFGNQEGRLHFAWKVNKTWKVGAVVGIPANKRPSGWVGIEASW